VRRCASSFLELPEKKNKNKKQDAHKNNVAHVFPAIKYINALYNFASNSMATCIEFV
jgi:hypothetical protein